MNIPKVEFHDSLSGSRSVRLPLNRFTHSSVLSTTYLLGRASKRASRNHERDSGSLPPIGGPLTAGSADSASSPCW
jgi:hypothetical protein